MYSNYREQQAYDAGARGDENYNSIGIEERRAYDAGKASTGPGLIVLLFPFLVSFVKHFIYFYLAYRTATLLYFESYSYYWSSGPHLYMSLIQLTAVTFILGYFYTCFGYFLRGKMAKFQAVNDEKWKLLSTVLLFIEVIAPSLLVLLLTFPDYIFSRSGLTLILSVCGSLIYCVYLKNTFDKKSTAEISSFNEWAYDLGTGKKKDPEPLPEGHLYAKGNGGLTGVFIFFAVLIAVIMYLNSH